MYKTIQYMCFQCGSDSEHVFIQLKLSWNIHKLSDAIQIEILVIFEI